MPITPASLAATTSSGAMTPAEVVARAEKRVRATMEAEGGITENVIAHFAMWERIHADAVETEGTK